MCHMSDRGIPIVLLYRELSTRTTSSSIQRCLDIDVKRRRDIAKDRSRWRRELRRELCQGNGLRIAAEEKRNRRKDGNWITLEESIFKCSRFCQDCLSGVGPYRHSMVINNYQSKLRLRAMVSRESDEHHLLGFFCFYGVPSGQGRSCLSTASYTL